MNTFFDVMLVRTLKGAPLSIFILLTIAKHPVGAQYLEENSGYTTKSVNAGLHILQQYGLISRNSRYAWQITADALQLPLSKIIDSICGTKNLPDVDFECDLQAVGVVAVDTDNAPSGSGKNSMSPFDHFSGSGKNSMSFLEKGEKTVGSGKNSMSEVEKFPLPCPSSSSLINLEKKLEKDPLLLEKQDMEKKRIQDCMNECAKFGIEEPKRTSLCKKPYVTCELIRYHCQTAENIRMAIYHIDMNWRIPKGWADEMDSKQGFQGERIDKDMNKQLQPSAELVELWENIKKAIQEAANKSELTINKADFETWINHAMLTGVSDQGYTLTVYNKYAAEWIETHVLKMISDLLNEPVTVVIYGSTSSQEVRPNHD